MLGTLGSSEDVAVTHANNPIPAGVPDVVAEDLQTLGEYCRMVGSRRRT